MQMSIADIRVLFVTIIMNIIFKRFAAEHHTKIMSGRKRYWQPVSVELPKNSMDLWMDFLSLLCISEGIEIKGSSTEFDENMRYKTLNKAVYIDELIRRHGKIMDEYDPLKK